MENSEDLQYSSDALAARFLLYQGLYKINLLVEDKNKEYEYETIFKRLLGDKYKVIMGIFASGGKSKLVDWYNEFGTEDKNNSQIKNIFIADGDFDRYVKSETMIKHPNFIYLETYNIESYYIDEEACIQYVKGKMKCLDKTVRKKLDFSRWKATIVDQSSKLFLLYCCLAKYHPNIETVSRKIGLFIDTKTGFERKDGAFQEYFNEIKGLDNNIQDKIDEIKKIYNNLNGNDYFNLICGKFLIRSLSFYIRSITGSKMDNDDFRWYLINNFNIEKLNYVKKTILDIAS